MNLKSVAGVAANVCVFPRWASAPVAISSICEMGWEYNWKRRRRDERKTERRENRKAGWLGDDNFISIFMTVAWSELTAGARETSFK